MKAQQIIVLLAALPGLNGILLAEETPQNTVPQQQLTFPPGTQAQNQPQYTGAATPGPRFSGQTQAYSQPSYQQPSYYPYGYNPYAYNPYGSYYPYAYNPYGMQQRMMPYNYARPPMPPPKKETKPWGDTRYIWPDFYTDFTGDFWDTMINAPYDMGYMPGGWRFPSLSSPDPITVGDAVANQVPPFAEEAGNMVPVDDIPNAMPF